jgi:hypothetical protein
MEKTEITTAMLFAKEIDKERANELFNSHTESLMLGRARMQASLIKENKKILGRFEAMFYRFGAESKVTRIFANRLLILWEGSNYENAFLKGARFRQETTAVFDIDSDLSHMENLLYELGFRSMDQKIRGLL